MTIEADDPRAAFLRAAVAPLHAHASGTLAEADAILAAHPEVATSGIHAAAVLGDDAAVRRFLADDPASATARGGPYGWDPLTHLCFSRYLRLDPLASDGFVRAAEALLDAGAPAQTGFESDDRPPVFESAIYGVAGVAHHPGLTRLLLARGADPNDDETPYHAPETYDNRALEILVESGTLTDDSLATILARKSDWHDEEAIRCLLLRGADPGRVTPWGRTVLHHAISRDNSAAIVEAMLVHGADAEAVAEGRSAIALAARRGRGDLLELFRTRGIPIDLDGADRLVAACALGDDGAVRSIAERKPHLVREVVAGGGRLLAEFAGNGNTEGVERLLDLGVDVAARYAEGDGYFGVAPDSTALHVAAWRARHQTVRLLIERGAPVDARDGQGRTPLALAVKACVDSYWTERRSPESVAALLQAGAPARGVPFPSGYAEVDDLLRRHGAG